MKYPMNSNEISFLGMGWENIIMKMSHGQMSPNSSLIIELPDLDSEKIISQNGI